MPTGRVRPGRQRIDVRAEQCGELGVVRAFQLVRGDLAGDAGEEVGDLDPRMREGVDQVELGQVPGQLLQLADPVR